MGPPLKPTSSSFVLANASVPTVLMAGGPTAAGDVADLVLCDLHISDGRIAAMAPSGRATLPSGEVIDLARGMVLPRFVDVHTHIDKGQIVQRTPGANGTHEGARQSVGADRDKNWLAADVRARMDFILRCAYAHGTGTIRTHIDSIGKQTGISWPVFGEMREAWRGRIALQAVSLFPVLFALDDAAQFDQIVATVARHGGLLGGLTFMNEPIDPRLDAALDKIFAAATAHGLDVDFHVDESASPDARSLERIADAILRTKFKGQVTCGHCCSLALQDEAGRARVIGKLRDANIAVVSLPMCNMYLQDRSPDRTPRWRGVAPLHELDAAGVRVMVASDNTRDPFYAYGDMDMLEVYREATRILQFDHSARPWLRLLGPAPAEVMGIDGAGRIAVGGPADLVLVGARSVNELLSRPWSDRVVLVGGKAINTTLPDYRELDAVFG